ncbi:MAG: laccase domain-containing protein, partial [Polyangiales bacterium]
MHEVGRLSPEFTGAQRRRDVEHNVGVRRSRLLARFGFRHGFAERTGGVSAPPFDTLNLGLDLGDSDAAVSENRQRFASSLGVAAERLFEQRQVHGTESREVQASDRASEILGLEGDALLTRVAGVAVAARTADCVPLL